MASRYNELQGDDYKRMGISRGIASTMSGDSEKMMQSLRQNIKKQGLQDQYKFGRDKRTGEILLFNNGKLEGTINKKGASKQDVYNFFRDPTNALMLVPGLGVASKVTKAPGVAKKLSTFFKQGSKLGAATGATDLANSALANKEGNQDLIQQRDINRAATAALLAPVAEVVGDKVIRGVGNKILPKKTKLKQEGSNVKLTPGQASGDKASLDYEARASKGEFGSKAQTIIDDYKTNQVDSLKDTLSDPNKNKIGTQVSVYNPERNVELASTIQNQGINRRVAEDKQVKKVYQNVDMDAFGISQGNADFLKTQAEANLPAEARADVAVDKADSPAYQSVKFVDALNKRLSNASKNSIKNPKNLEEVYKTQGGDIDIPLSDGTIANFRYGDYNPVKGKGFVGKKLEMKHPNTATPDLEDKLKNAKLSHIEPSGTKIFYTEDGVKVVVDKNNRVISTYKPDPNYKKRQGSPASSPWVPDAYDVASQQQTLAKQDIPQQKTEVNLKKAFALPTKEQAASEMERIYNVYSMDVLEGRRRTLNKLIKQAVAKGDEQAERFLMQQKKAFDDYLDELYTFNRLEGNADEYAKLKQARELQSEYKRKFEDAYSRDEFGKRYYDSGAKEFIDLLSVGNNSTPDAFAKTLGLSDVKKQLGIIRRAKEIFGKDADPYLQEMYLNNIFTDLARVGQPGEINLKQAIKNFTEKVEKNSAVIKELFDAKQISHIKDHIDVIKKLNRSFDSNPSGTSSAVRQYLSSLVFGLDLRFMPNPLKVLRETIYEPAKIRRYLNQNAIKQQRFKEPNKTTESLAKLLYAPVNTQEEQ